MTNARWLLPLAICAVLVAGCSEGDDGGAAETTTVVTVIKEVAAEPEPAAEAEPEPEPEPEKSTASTKRKKDSGSSSSSGCIRVPDVEGEDHQLAQDTMQAAGLYMLEEEDATGQGRMLLWDRNWTVVEQDPAAGACVSDDTTITLRSKKDGE